MFCIPDTFSTSVIQQYPPATQIHSPGTLLSFCICFDVYCCITVYSSPSTSSLSLATISHLGTSVRRTKEPCVTTPPLVLSICRKKCALLCMAIRVQVVRIMYVSTGADAMVNVFHGAFPVSIILVMENFLFLLDGTPEVTFLYSE